MTLGWRLMILAAVALGCVALVSNAVLTFNRESLQVHSLVQAELGFCERLQSVRDGVNRHGALIYVVLRKAAQRTAERGDDALSEEYRTLSGLPMYRPPTDCDRAVNDPGSYRPVPAVPFRTIPHDRLPEIIGAPIQP